MARICDHTMRCAWMYWTVKIVDSGVAVDVFVWLKDSINAYISHLRNWSLREGKQWEIGKGRWIINSEWIIIYRGVHSTVLSSLLTLSTAPLLPTNNPIRFQLLNKKSTVDIKVGKH